MSTQSDINYGDDAQRRVAADTLTYQKKATLVVPDTGFVSLPTDLIVIDGIYKDETTELDYATSDDLLAFLSSGSTQSPSNAVCASIVGRTLYVFPTPSEDLTLTLVYRARPVVWQSNHDFVLSGPYETLIDQLVQADLLLDNGQTTVAQAMLAQYDQTAGVMRRRAGAKPGTSGRLRRVGQRL